MTVERFPRLTIAKKFSDADQQVFAQHHDFGGIAPQAPGVFVKRVNIEKSHPPLNATDEHRLLVTGKALTMARFQDPQNFTDSIATSRLRTERGGGTPVGTAR